MSDAVRYHRDGHVGVLTLDRPDNRNSMTVELLEAFTAASATARGDAGARCVVITGNGACFSAGADFKSTGAQGNSDPDDLRAPHERSFAMYEPFLSVLDLVVPVIGALNGHAIGGGFGLALMCDLRIAAVGAKYGANFVKLGIGPGMAISYLLPRLIGVARASELLFTGALVDGTEAARLGLVNRALPAAEVLPAAMELARTIAANAPMAVRATKRAMQRAVDLGQHVRDAARLEAFAQAETLATTDSREGIAALLAKRAPEFTGH